jgi:ATP-dependent protease ClpP protease subunit
VVEKKVDDLHKEAQIVKALAEARKYEAEATNLEVNETDVEVERNIRLADLRSTVAAADQAETEAEISRITMDAQLRQEKFTLLSDHYHNHMDFRCDVDYKSVDKALQQLRIWDRIDPKSSWFIDIQSDGGSALDGFALFDRLVAHSKRGKIGKDGKRITNGKHHVTMTVLGHAASMGAILLQAADERVIGPEGVLMIHKVSAGAAGKVNEIMNTAKFLERMCDRIAAVFVERSNGRIDLETFNRKWEHNDWWITSEEALDLGFVDRIG